MIFSHKEVAPFLKAELAHRMSRDPAYSLRAMAKDLQLSPAYLSQIINRKKHLSPERSLEVSKLLGLDERETRYLYLLVQLEGAPDGDIHTSIVKQLHDLAHSYEDQALEAENFRVISDWYHVPIMEMTYLDGFTVTDASVSERLGISVTEAGAALERLVRLGLLEVKDGAYQKTEQNYLFRTSRRNEAFGRFLRQMMDLAGHAMDHHEVAERIVMSQTFCISRGQLEEARQITREYMQRMAGLFESATTKEETYQLCVQFFNLTDGRRKSEVIRDAIDDEDAAAPDS